MAYWLRDSPRLALSEQFGLKQRQFLGALAQH